MNCGRRPVHRVEWRCDGQKKAAAARASTAAHRHLLPAGGRGGDGLFGVVGQNTASRAGRRHLLSDQVRHLRGDRAGRHVPRLAPESGARAPLHGRAADRQLRDAPDGQGPRRRRAGQRRAPLAGLRPAAVPAERDHEDRTRPAHIRRDREPAEDRALDPHAHRAGDRRRGRGGPADRAAAGSRHRPRDLRDRRHDDGRGGPADAPARPPW